MPLLLTRSPGSPFAPGKPARPGAPFTPEEQRHKSSWREIICVNELTRLTRITAMIQGESRKSEWLLERALNSSYPASPGYPLGPREPGAKFESGASSPGGPGRPGRPFLPSGPLSPWSPRGPLPKTDPGGPGRPRGPTQRIEENECIAEEIIRDLDVTFRSGKTLRTCSSNVTRETLKKYRMRPTNSTRKETPTRAPDAPGAPLYLWGRRNATASILFED